jgi:starch-binding outer membrane protein, SusD/RagB family
MKKRSFYILLAMFFLSLAGCKKWLDVSPKTEVRESELLSDEQGFKDAMIGLYTQLGGASTYGTNLTMGVLDGMAQRYNVSATSHIFYYPARYDYTATSSKNYIAAIWGGLYTSVANLNNILSQIDSKQAVFSDNNYRIVKGEALALRALLHFDLLRLFGVAPVVDGNRKSIPYVTRFGVSVYPLLSVNAVMDSCLKDLADAEQLLAVDKAVRLENPADPFLSYTRNHMNYWAVKGLQARIYLYRGDKQAALAAAQEVISHQVASFPFVSSTAASATVNRDRTYSTEHLFALNVFKLKEITEALTRNAPSNGAPALVQTTSNINSLYESSAGGSSDMRYVYLFTPFGTSQASTKYWQDDLNAEVLKGNVPIIRLSEMYYIAAESAATPAEGVDYLNIVREKRGLVALPLTISAVSLQTEILKEYKKEFYAEGQLFYYFKRKNAARVDGSTINMTEATYVFPLPENEIEFANRF